jgi:hypothetical protein
MTWEYLAGFTDADGCISFGKRIRDGRESWYFAIRWAQAERASIVLDEIATFLRAEGIAVNGRQFNVSRAGQVYPQRELNVQGRQTVLDILRKLEPHLILKREKAQEGIAVLAPLTVPKPARVCGVLDCGRPHVARGRCRRHYMREWSRNHGSS